MNDLWEKRKKELIKERFYRGVEKQKEKREERQIDREICGKRRGRRSDNEGVRREKKWESLPWERMKTQKKCFPRQRREEIIFIGDAMREREIVFQYFFFGKLPIENKPYFY